LQTTKGVSSWLQCTRGWRQLQPAGEQLLVCGLKAILCMAGSSHRD